MKNRGINTVTLSLSKGVYRLSTFRQAQGYDLDQSNVTMLQVYQ
jgi:hypothetical protein